MQTHLLLIQPSGSSCCSVWIESGICLRVCVCVGGGGGGKEITSMYYLSWSKIGDVSLSGCRAGLRLRILNGGTKACEPEGGGERMSCWDDNAAWHLWNESPVTMAKKQDGTVSQEPEIKPAVNDVWLVFRLCSCCRNILSAVFSTRSSLSAASTVPHECGVLTEAITWTFERNNQVHRG